MASSTEFVEYIVEQLSDAGVITCKKMFGEYGVYLNGIYFAMICNDRLLVKMTSVGEKIMPEYETDFPYMGAKPCFLITDLENKELLTKLALETCKELITLKPTKKATKTDNKKNN